MFVTEDPKAKIDKFPAHVREAIRLGQVAMGMTEKQAIIASAIRRRMKRYRWKRPWELLGVELCAVWRMWGKDGRIKEIVTDPAIRSRCRMVNASPIIKASKASLSRA